MLKKMHMPKVIIDIIMDYHEGFEIAEKYDRVMREMILFAIFHDPVDTISLIKLSKMNLDLSHGLSKNAVLCVLPDNMTTSQLRLSIKALQYSVRLVPQRERFPQPHIRAMIEDVKNIT